MDIALGQVVYSKAGRDEGRKFIVVDIVDENYIMLSDGDLRKVEKPKKKKIKHIKPTEIIIEPLAEKFRNGQKVTNAEIRKTLANIENGLDKKEIKI
ncbi:MAG TPA: RNA-binding protein [Clostridiaceae bacterium]|nr:RNA-binding protein [Clostridiaceae bacterium]